MSGRETRSRKPLAELNNVNTEEFPQKRFTKQPVISVPQTSENAAEVAKALEARTTRRKKAPIVPEHAETKIQTRNRFRKQDVEDEKQTPPAKLRRVETCHPHANAELLAPAVQVPEPIVLSRSTFTVWQSFRPASDVSKNCQRQDVPLLLEATIRTADGRDVVVYFDWHIAAKKIVARQMHNPDLSGNSYELLKRLNLPAKGLKFRVNEPAGSSGHVHLSIAQLEALRMEVTGIWDTRKKAIVIQPLAVVATVGRARK
jgi:hypothetical protein